MTEEEARIIAEPVVRGIVDCMACRDYARDSAFETTNLF